MIVSLYVEVRACFYLLFFSISARPKRSAFHLADECFVPFSVSLAMPSKTPFAAVVNQLVLRASQSGFVLKIRKDIDWEGRRNNTGQLLQVILPGFSDFDLLH